MLMRPYLKKSVSLLTAAAIVMQAVLLGTFSSAQAAGGSEETFIGTRSAGSAPAELKSRIAEQTAFLKQTGKATAYSEASLRWDSASRQPAQVRGLKIKAGRNVAEDVRNVLTDLSPVYGIRAGTKPARTFSVKKESSSKSGGMKHYRIAQSFSGITIV